LIGSHTVDLLLQRGYSVKILDNLEKPTHLSGLPEYVPAEAEFILGDVRSPADLAKALSDVDVIFHLAATGGFTPHYSKYIDNNSLGTSRMLEMIKERALPIKKILVASSVAVYGEGGYLCEEHGKVPVERRSEDDLKDGNWEMRCPYCRSVLKPVPTPESSPPSPQNFYSLSKYSQERMCLIFGMETGIPVVAARYFVTFGPRQSIYNPYTGVCSIFATRIINDLPPIIYEDGLQMRDFVFVKDVASANILMMESEEANNRVFNVGTGKRVKIIEVAEQIAKILGKDILPEISGEYRASDVRHIIADISEITRLGFRPVHSFEEGIQEFILWLKRRGKVPEYLSRCRDELIRAGVIRKKDE